MMYLGDLSERFILRLTFEQKQFCINMAEHFNMNPSSFIRMLIDNYMYMTEGDSHNEDEQTFFDSKL